MSIGQVSTQVFNPETRPTTAIPEEGNNSTFKKNFGKFERPGATYSWNIYRPGREKLVGYSKPAGMAEKTNKQELLLDIIRRLGQRDYIREGMRIEFFRCVSDDDNDSVKLMTLFGTRFIAESIILTEAWLIKFLKNFYNPIVYDYATSGGLFPTGGKPAPPEGMAIIPDASKQAPAKDPFDPSRKFKNEEALMAYMEKLLRDGHPHGRVSAWYTEQIKKFDRNFS